MKEHGLPEKETLSLEDISTLSGIPSNALAMVRDRGYGAWKTNIASVRLKSGKKDYDLTNNPRGSRMSKEQWAYGRLMAFVMKTKKVYYGSDNDIREHYGLE